MKKLIYTLAIVAFLLNVKSVKAQDNTRYFNMYYSMGLATGDLHDYISKYSWRGMGMEWKMEASENIMLGIGVDWNVFYEDIESGSERGTFTKELTKSSVSLTGDQFRYTNLFPMAAHINYFKDNESGLRYFIGTAIGTTYLMRELDMGVYRYSNDTWQFLIAPEAGITLDLDAAHSLLISAKYNYNFNSNVLDGQSYLSFNIGFTFNN